MTDRILRLHECLTMTGLSRSTWHRKIKEDPHFPKPVRLGECAVGWIESEVQDWIDALKAEREG